MDRKAIESHDFLIKKYRSQCLAIVESVLVETDIDRQAFLRDCDTISKCDYDDIISERSLIAVCGYPLCTNKLNTSAYKRSQKYHISLHHNRVYDITERKLFCSSLCFRASNYLRQQISDEPIWLRPDSRLERQFVVYDDSDRVGVGQRHDMDGHELPLSEHHVDDCEYDDHNTCLSSLRSRNSKMIASPYIKEEQLSQLRDHIQNLTITEKELKL